MSPSEERHLPESSPSERPKESGFSVGRLQQLLRRARTSDRPLPDVPVPQLGTAPRGRLQRALWEVENQFSSEETSSQPAVFPTEAENDREVDRPIVTESTPSPAQPVTTEPTPTPSPEDRDRPEPTVTPPSESVSADIESLSMLLENFGNGAESREPAPQKPTPPPPVTEVASPSPSDRPPTPDRDRKPRVREALEQYRDANMPSPEAIEPQKNEPQKSPVRYRDPSASVRPLDRKLERSVVPISPSPHTETELEKMRSAVADLAQKLDRVERQVREPTELIDPLIPLIATLLEKESAAAKGDIVKSVVPVIDRIIKERTQDDRSAMSAALSEIVPDAISYHIREHPNEIAAAIAPEIAAAIEKQIELDRDSITKALASEMGRAIKAQIELERDAMVDALYPVIGNTISKYLAEEVKRINDKVENALSLEGVQRKVRARVQGVSEAELILRESMPFQVRAVFLIHKASGLVIAEAQDPTREQLESGTIAGMLTAIRSFASDTISQGGNTTELHEIEYGDSQILLEVAGYCYLAVAARGEPPKRFIIKLRRILETIVQKYGTPIEEFDGDPDTVPEPVRELVADLIDIPPPEPDEETGKRRGPPALLVIGAIALLGALWLAGRAFWHRHLERQAAIALESTPELAVYRLETDMRGGAMSLSGRLPNGELRQQAGEVVRQALPNQEVENNILAVDVPPDPGRIRAELKRLTAALDRVGDIEIATRYDDRTVRVEGRVDGQDTANTVVETLESVPGVTSVVATLQLRDSPTEQRIYFDRNSARIDDGDLDRILKPIYSYLEQNPTAHLEIIGHSDRIGNPVYNQILARDRAENVKEVLVEWGIRDDRLLVRGSSQPPPGIETNAPPQLGRTVRFQTIESGKSASKYGSSV